DDEVEVVPLSGPRLLPKGRGWWGRASLLAARTAVYPLRAWATQGQVNHVVDHSYGHLVHFLDPARTVVTVHDLAPLGAPEPGGRWGVSARLWRWSLRGACKAARLIADSAFTREELLRWTDYPPGRIVVIPCGVAPAFRPLEDEGNLRPVRERYGLPEGRLLLHVGHGARRKNLAGLLQALARVVQAAGDVHLVQVGARPGQAEETLVARLGLQGRVRWLGTVPGQDLPALYNLADCFVFPSLYEGFGLPVLEAMACGTPVVCSHLASLPEVAGDAALLVDPRDPAALAQAVLQVLEDAALRQGLREAGLRRAGAFTWACTAAATANVYREVWREVGERAGG
ncbi:MAG: glycosyltransferase family 4 protein, partial [Anaerolineae bacterium]|nr:glycosyltransferase family 4 protein [Anaerolineae bacterium]